MRSATIALCLAALIGAAEAIAQQYPVKPVRFLVGFSAGSTIDTVSRVVLEEIRRSTGATIVVDNRPGALGLISTDLAAKAAPDGYTLTASSSATNSSGPQLAKTVPYDPVKDFTHIGGVFRFDLMLVVNPAQGFRTVHELIAEAKKNPDKLTFGYGSATGQVAASSFNRAAGIQARGVPYKGQPLALNDLMGGQINFVAADIGALMSLVRAGKLAALGVSSSKRSSILPAVPTFAELGLKDVELSGWFGMSGPAGLSPETTEWWARNISAALARKEIIEQFRAMGVEPDPQTGKAFQQFVREQYDVWGKHIRAAGIEAQ
ncbi:MAG: tripartite tricarboxylate transporter substrate binding protein [Betaproteobacteria bacterium]|nr:tripartite tricarboxylate transporter substrate binding protein [Betaproteobacteria bacterium]